jgi:hypothetical protein
MSSIYAMKHQKRCESCLRVVDHQGCRRHPGAAVLDEGRDAEWLTILGHQQRRQRRQHILIKLMGLSVLGLWVAPLLSVSALHLLVVRMLWERRHAAPAEPGVLLRADDGLTEPVASTSAGMARRNRRVARMNARDRATVSRVQGAG